MNPIKMVPWKFRKRVTIITCVVNFVCRGKTIERSWEIGVLKKSILGKVS